MTYLAWRALMLLAVVLLGVACGTGSDVPSSAPRFALPTIPADWARDPNCAGVELTPLVLKGQTAEGATSVTANGNVPISWPPGYTATFDPSLVVWSPDGREFARGGEDMTGVVWHGTRVCVMGDPGGPPGKLVIWIAPPG